MDRRFDTGPDAMEDATTDTIADADPDTTDVGDTALDTSADTADVGPDVMMDAEPDADGCVRMPEVCNDRDDDCDGRVDEIVVVHYADVDGDEAGDPETEMESCDVPVGRVTNGTDCDDNDSGVNPGATEVCDGVDNDCNGETDEGMTVSRFLDRDGDDIGGARVDVCEDADGVVDEGGDCDDDDPDVNPDVTEVCNAIDDNCDGSVDRKDGESVCPSDCTPHRFEGHVYLMCNNTRSWMRARNFCRDDTDGVTAELVAITTLEEDLFVESLVTMRPEGGDPWATAAWIGLTDNGPEEEGMHRWTMRDEEAIYFRWADGEPNDGELFANEDCVFMINRVGAGWNDNRCNESRRFVCESN